MNVALMGTSAGAGLALRAPRISVTENVAAPLLMVASVCSSGETARPNGFGAPTSTSTPAGVTKRPLGRIAPERPSTVVDSAVGRSPAGARKRRNPERAAADSAPARAVVPSPSGRALQATP